MRYFSDTNARFERLLQATLDISGCEGVFLALGGWFYAAITDVVREESVRDFQKFYLLNHLNFPTEQNTFKSFQSKDLQFYNSAETPELVLNVFPICTDDGTCAGHLVLGGQCEKSTSSTAAIFNIGALIAETEKMQARITNFEKAEEEAKGTEVLMNTIFNNAVDAVVIVDENNYILQWNPQAEVVFGWNEPEVMGHRLHELILPQSEWGAFCQWVEHTDYFTVQPESHTHEFAGVRKNGDELYIAFGISPAQINGKKYFFCFLHDITERKQATQLLDNQKKFYENILNALPSDIAVFDTEHRYLFVNPLGIKDAELRKYIIGKDDFEYCEYRNRDKSVAELRRAMFLQVKETREEIRWEDTVYDPQGNPKTSLRRIFPVFDDNGDLSMVIGFGLDITDRKLMEEKQALMLKQLSVQNGQLTDFCNIVSHNLRAPLVNMSMLVDYIQESETEDEKNDLIMRLNPVIENLHLTFNELVESLQVKQNADIEREPIQVEQFLLRVLKEHDLEIEKCGAKVEYDFSSAPTIQYPSSYFYSILQNLVSNALKYRSPARPPRIKVTTEDLPNEVMLTVGDNGLGIDLEKHKENFFKIGKVFHRHPNAKGFGLFMTKTQIEAMDGTIRVESTPDVGTTFFITIPKKR